VIGLGQGMTYLPDESQVLYRSKDGKNERTFDALEWLAAMCSHVPNKGDQMVRYYGYYSNVCRGQPKKANEDGLEPCILQPDESSKGYRKNWARLIQKIYEIDPLTCPKPVLSLSKDAKGRWPSSLSLRPKTS
jgi:hypothetical protein